MEEQKVIKACNFYVSEWHLFAALLPYLKEELKERNKIVFIAQDNLEKGLKELVNKLSIKFANENGIEDITWLNENFLIELKENIDPINIIVQGTLEFVTKINNYLNEHIINIYRDIRIINCYEVFDTNTMLYNILDEHDYVFNTGGMHEKTEIFPGYRKEERHSLK